MMIAQSASQQIQQLGIFVLLKDHVIEEFFGENLLVLGRERENLWQTFDDHQANLSGTPAPFNSFHSKVPRGICIVSESLRGCGTTPRYGFHPATATSCRFSNGL